MIATVLLQETVQFLMTTILLLETVQSPMANILLQETEWFMLTIVTPENSTAYDCQ